MSKCLILLIFSPQFHIPVDWIPVIPAGMTGFQHKSVRVEIFRGIRVIPSLQKKEVSRKDAKTQRRAIFFAPLRLCVKLAFGIVGHSCILTSIATLVYNDESSRLGMGFLNI